MTSCSTLRLALMAVSLLAAGLQSSRGAWIWVEGEKPVRASVQRHPFWYDQVKRGQFSGSDFLSNWGPKPGLASYRVNAPSAGTYEFWVRANPLQAKLSYKLNSGSWVRVPLDREQQGNSNVAADGKADLRFLAWAKAGSLDLAKGASTIQFRMESENNNHGYLDCFVLSQEPFTPNGAIRPDQAAAAAQRAAESNPGWFAFAPAPDRFSSASAIDLRFLNEKVAGEGGFIGVKGASFVHSKTGQPVKFWAVNGPSGKDKEALRREARMLAKRGVNLVRVHHSWYDAKTGLVDEKAIALALDVVAAMKAEGIYTHISLYFPLWLTPEPGTPWLQGYDGNAHPFASLFFNQDFQRQYQGWWRALLLAKDPATGQRLVDDPAVAGVEILNEDSYFFWTFDRKNIPDPQLRILESQFANWLTQRHGSLQAAAKRWGGLNDPRDAADRGRIALRPLWNVFNERTERDKDTVRFLAASQRGFYESTYRFLRDIGFRGVINTSNWNTADPATLGPIERYTYTAGDFIDRHGYFGGVLKGENSSWSIREGQVYTDRSALRFDPPEPGEGKPRVFASPAIDIAVAGKPSMISEASWTRPNRHRSEAPLFFAAYGALQGSDGIVQFALDGPNWSVKPGFYMQPWTLMTPGQMGQFPAAALIFRQGLVAEGDLLVDLNLKLGDLFDLQGTPMPQDANLDELRLKDVPQGTTLRPGNVIDPLVHFAGRTSMTFSDAGAKPVLKDLRPYVDHARKQVVSTNKHLRLDYGKGCLTIDAPAAQGASGDLRAAGTVETRDLSIASTLEIGHIVAVSLDGAPLATSKRILLQVMSEEKPTDFRASPESSGAWKITSIGRDPWLVKQFEGTVRFKRPDAAKLNVTALDENGEPHKTVPGAEAIRLGSRVLYYLISPTPPAAVR